MGCESINQRICVVEKHVNVNNSEFQTANASVLPKAPPEIRRVLEDARRHLGNPIAMLDTSYNLLAHTDNPIADDPLWNELIGSGTFSDETVNYFNRSQFIRSVAESEVTVLLRDESQKYDRICGKFFDNNGVQLGDIVAVACEKPFSDGDFDYITALCERISKAIDSHDTFKIVERVFFDRFISDMLNETDPGKIRKAWEDAGYRETFGPYIFAAVADISQYDPTITSIAYLRDKCASAQPEYAYFIYLNNIVILIGRDTETLSVNRDMCALDDYFRRHSIFAGVSGAFQSPFQFRSYYKKALTALNRGMNHPCGINIFNSESFGAEGLLNAAGAVVEPREMCNPILLQMQEYDKTHGTLYLSTVGAYLKSGKKKRLACEQLKIARDGLNRRLAEAEAKFEIDLDDGNLMASLLISLKILERQAG